MSWLSIRLDESFEYKGLWWQPEHGDQKLAGTLSFSPEEGLRLHTLGSFADSNTLFDLPDIPVLFGLSASGASITLENCACIEAPISWPGIAQQTFHVRRAFIDAHITSGGQALFSSLVVSFSHLDEWVNVRTFHVAFESGARDFVITYTHPPSIDVKLADDDQVSLCFARYGPIDTIPQTEMTIRQQAYIKIKPKDDLPLDQMLEKMRHIQHFLSLAVAHPISPLSVSAQLGSTGTSRGGTASIVYKPFQARKRRRLIPRDMLFTFEGITDSFGAKLSAWFKREVLLKPVFDLYFATKYSPSIYVEHRFLNLVQAVEAYHRRTCGNEDQPPEQHSQRLQAIVDAVPADQREWVAEKLKYSNELSLRHRLRALVERYPWIVSQANRERKSFISKVYATRNYLTHYDQSLGSAAATSSIEIHNLSEKLDALLQACFLSELGFSGPEIRASITNAPIDHDE